MICFNKFLINKDRFPFATMLTTLHMSNSLVLSTCLYQFAPSMFPTAHHIFGSRDNKKRPGEVLEALLPFSLIALCGAVALVAGNTAYKFSSVAFLQMVKESHIIFVYTMMVIVGLDQLRLRNCCILMFIAASAAVAVYGDVVFSVTGLALQMVSGASGAAQVVLTNLLMSRQTGPRLDPMTTVLCTAPMMLLYLIPASIYNWDASIMVQARAYWPLLLANMGLAFALQIATAVTIRGISATGHALASVLKDVCIVAAAGLLLGENLSILQIGGFVSTICGISLYSSMKLFPDMKLCPWSTLGKHEDKSEP
mmetsp:Transcript_28086/g.64881  ORF Transcript_28086/g.64881 Transcript_28086/m.64881 type:complete len:311 (+) Transcript_28086:1-933(+)